MNTHKERFGNEELAAVDRNAHYFDCIAPIYDISTSDGQWKANRLLARALAKSAGVNRLLDLGAGTGQTLSAALAIAQPREICAVDNSAGMLAILRRRFGAVPGVRAEQASIDTYLAQAAPPRYDFITAIGSLEFVPQLPVVLRSLHRHLEVGGEVAFTYEPLLSAKKGQQEPETTFSIASTPPEELTVFRWEPEEIRSALAEQGLAIIVDEYAPGVYQRGNQPVDYRFVVAATRPSPA